MLLSTLPLLFLPGACADPCVLSGRPCDNTSDCADSEVCRLQRNNNEIACLFAKGICETGNCGSVSDCAQDECCAPKGNRCVPSASYSGACDALTCRSCSGVGTLDAGAPEPADASHEPLCYGTIETCATVGSTLSACQNQAGCYPELACLGESSDCTAFLSEQACVQDDMCHWIPECAGIAYTCELLGRYDPGGCATQLGCQYVDGQAGSWQCLGYATPCNQLVGTDCADQEGCSWSGVCTPIESPCDTLSESDCGVRSECTWGMLRCLGSASVCLTLENRDLCEQQRGCIWGVP